MVQDGQLFPGPGWISHDGETVDPAVGQGGCQGRRRSGLPAELGKLRGEIKYGHMWLPVWFPDHRQGTAHLGSGDSRVIVDGRDVVRDDFVTRRGCLLNHHREVFGRYGLSENGSLRHLAGQPQRPRSPHTGEDWRHHGRRMGKLHTIELNVAAAEVDALPTEQPPQSLDVLLQQREQARRPGSDLIKPARHAMPYAHRQPARVEPRQGSDLHGGERHIARCGWDNSQAHVQ